MKKIYPIINPIEVNDYDKNDDIIDSSLPSWLKREMEKVAKIEKCSIRELEYARRIFFDGTIWKWFDMGEISHEPSKE
jgi:hypothetical protein